MVKEIEDIFHALRGCWYLKRRMKDSNGYLSDIFEGQAEFEPFDAGRIIRTQAHQSPHQGISPSQYYIYKENGELTGPNGSFTYQATKRYIYKFTPYPTNQISVWFVRSKNNEDIQLEGLFHDLMMGNSNIEDDNVHQQQDTQIKTIKAEGTHLCADDRYNTTYIFEMTTEPCIDSFSIQHDVRGPKKNHSIITNFKRR